MEFWGALTSRSLKIRCDNNNCLTPSNLVICWDIRCRYSKKSTQLRNMSVQPQQPLRYNNFVLKQFWFLPSSMTLKYSWVNIGFRLSQYLDTTSLLRDVSISDPDALEPQWKSSQLCYPEVLGFLKPDTLTSGTVTMLHQSKSRIPLTPIDWLMLPNDITFSDSAQQRKPFACWHGGCYGAWNAVLLWPVRWRRRRLQSVVSQSPICLVN